MIAHSFRFRQALVGEDGQETASGKSGHWYKDVEQVCII